MTQYATNLATMQRIVDDLTIKAYTIGTGSDERTKKAVFGHLITARKACMRALKEWSKIDAEDRKREEERGK
jgi:hypothetical protein